MKELMLADTPVRERKQILRDSCDAIEERSYTRRFEQSECNQRKSELASVAIKINDLEQELAEIKADYKGRIKPLQERLGILRDEIKVNGEWVTADVYKFIDRDERRCGYYIVDGEAMLQLISAGANEIAVEYRDSQLDEVLSKIREIAPDIAILEI